MPKAYVAADGDYVYARNETPDTVEASSADNVPRRPVNRSQTPHESIDMEDTKAFKSDGVNSGGLSFDATPSAAKSNADQQWVQSPASAANTDQDIADLYAVPMKKKKIAKEEPTPGSPTVDKTEIEHQENDLYQSCGNDEIVEDETFVVENDLYDQSSAVL